ncbi:hypothetical protein EVJ58_g5042 [Rhodofomes roseus]|uniref:TFIIS N-terminal domain-containing protein n=1 Tax=Rhodofomes roseus TaxID=34475 RepID=A0A4Y9YE54_9APHY|nr:hypothetical protein EVJ58_g5042 [Rhodofomes roseus]
MERPVSSAPSIELLLSQWCHKRIAVGPTSAGVVVIVGYDDRPRFDDHEWLGLVTPSTISAFPATVLAFPTTFATSATSPVSISATTSAIYVFPSSIANPSSTNAAARHSFSLCPPLFKYPTERASSVVLLWSTSTYAAPPKPVAPTPEQRRAALQAAIKPLLTPTSFTGAGAVAQLAGHIDDYGILDVEPRIRMEILSKMRDNAGNHYFRAWGENEDAMEITREWLKSAFAGKDDGGLLETVMPLLQTIDRLPMTLESLKASKLGKIIVKLVKDPPAPVSSHEESKRMDVDDDPKGKKRKAEAASTKAAPASKKAAISTSTTSSKPVAVKKEAKPVVKEVKDAKSDSSFFSAPKPKPRLPSFKKAPPPPIVKKELDPNVAQPSSFNPFEEALKSMAKSRKDSPATATPPPAPVSAPLTTAATSLTASGKPKKRVTWAPEGELERIKLIERAIYDDDPSDVSFIFSGLCYVLYVNYSLFVADTQGLLSTHNIRDLDRDEGAALHAHLFDDQIEWYEPILLEMPPEIDVRPRGEESQEKATQEEREQGALVALYVSEAQIPASPDEPPTQLAEEQADEGVKVMLTGPDVDAIFWTAGAPAAVEPPKQSVAELVGQLAAASGGDAFAGSTSAGAPPQLDSKPFGLDTNVIQALPNMNPEQLQQLVQALSQQNQSGIIQPQTPRTACPERRLERGAIPARIPQRCRRVPRRRPA